MPLQQEATPIAPHNEPIPLHSRATDDLAFIRNTMERSTRFTAISGLGGIGMGVIALTTAAIASRLVRPGDWVTAWLLAAGLAMATSIGFMVRKAKRAEVSLASGPGRKFLLALSPPLLVGAFLTLPLVQAGQVRLLPAMWLMLYGSAVIAAGVFSIRLVPLMGLSFVLLGIAALFAPVGTGDLFMAAGFGGLNIVCGSIIMRRYGG
jgi:hypothetical protein